MPKISSSNPLTKVFNLLTKIHSLQATYFLFKSKCYQQAHGAAKKSPISPIVATCSWNSMRSMPSNQLPIHLGCGLGIWMTPLSSKWQNTVANSCITSTLLAPTLSLLRKLQMLRAPFLFWTLKYFQNLKTHAHYSLQEAHPDWPVIALEPLQFIS